MAQITITVAGTPAPQGSKSKGRWGNLYESSRKLGPWREDVAAAVLAHRANGHLGGPLAVDATFFLARPKGHYGTGRNAAALRGDAPAYPLAKAHGDVDKYARGLLDALVLAGVMADDSLVIDLQARKRWADHPVSGGVRPGVIVRVAEVPAAVTP